MNGIEAQRLVKFGFNIAKVKINSQNQKEDTFLLFFCLWPCFNAWMTHESGKTKDLEMLAWFEDVNNSSGLKDAFLKASAGDPWKGDLRNFIKRCPIKDSRGIGADIVINSSNDFINILEALYRVIDITFQEWTKQYFV